MNNKQDMLKVPPEKLWLASKTLIPDISRVFGDATRGMQHSNTSEANAFGNSEGGWSMSKSQAKWDQLQNKLHAMFREIASRLDDAGETLNGALQNVINTDQAAAERLNEYIKNSAWKDVEPGGGYKGSGPLPKPGDAMGPSDYRPGRPDLW